MHATTVIFLEFFAWGLLTSPTIEALKIAFPSGTFLKNGIVQGVKVCGCKDTTYKEPQREDGLSNRDKLTRQKYAALYSEVLWLLCITQSVGVSNTWW